MLLNDFYTIETAGIESQAPVAAGTRAVLVLNATHPIFAGHFPGQPVVPGACQLQIVQELLSHVLASEYRLLQANQLKFLTPIDPRQHPRIEATLRYAAPHIDATATGPQTGLASTGTTGSGTSDNEQTGPAPVDSARESPAAGPLQVTATLSAGDTIFLKFTGTFRAG